ncbi:hypothetical protein ABID97_004900 [Variovorax sp. OAS795]
MGGAAIGEGSSSRMFSRVLPGNWQASGSVQKIGVRVYPGDRLVTARRRLAAGQLGADCRHPPTRMDWFLPHAAAARVSKVGAYLLNGDADHEKHHSLALRSAAGGDHRPEDLRHSLKNEKKKPVPVSSSRRIRASLSAPSGALFFGRAGAVGGAAQCVWRRSCCTSSRSDWAQARRSRPSEDCGSPKRTMARSGGARSVFHSEVSRLSSSM